MAYRGKYPRRIRAVYSVRGQSGLRVELNDGTRWQIYARTEFGQRNPPKLDTELGHYQNGMFAINYTISCVLPEGSAATCRAAGNRD